MSHLDRYIQARKAGIEWQYENRTLLAQAAYSVGVSSDGEVRVQGERKPMRHLLTAMGAHRLVGDDHEEHALVDKGIRITFVVTDDRDTDNREEDDDD